MYISRTLDIQVSLILCSVWFILGPTAPARACSVEILPITTIVTSANAIIVGIVDSVETKMVYQDEDAGFTLHEHSAAIILVEEVLKGHINPKPLRLAFQEGIGESSCAFLLKPYQPGNRLLLMITEKEQDTYFAPLVPPRLIVLKDISSPALKYVRFIATNGMPPIQIDEFQKPGSIFLSGWINISLKIINQMATPITAISPPNEQPLVSPSGTVIWFELRHRIVNREIRIPGTIASISIAPDQAMPIIIHFPGDYLANESSLYYLYIIVKLPTSEEEYYLDSYPVFSFSFNELHTPVLPETWGKAKHAR